MVSEITIEEYLQWHAALPLIDVRSPGEYSSGHIGGAVNIPLFSDEERAHVGTVYVRESREKAMELGYAYVTPKLKWYISESAKVAPEMAAAVHCWRGGMRSRAFAEHLHTNGFEKVFIIRGGYKAFRRYVLSFFETPLKLQIVGGFTGSGKTQILFELQKLGCQVVDLEALANHKGSAFGSLGEKEQPSVEQFENFLFEKIRGFDRNKPIWMEDESHSIGRVQIPLALFKQMRQSTVFFLDIPKKERAKYLVESYSQFGNEALSKAIVGITKRLGFDKVKLALQRLEANDYYEVALITLYYYDKAYLRGITSRTGQKVIMLPLADMNHQKNAEILIQNFKKNGRD